MESVNNNDHAKTVNNKNSSVKLPKNIKQVGIIETNKHIFIEDYVMTYIKQMALKSYGVYQAAVLLGHIEKDDNFDYIFISGAVEAQDILFEEDMVFTNEAWTLIYENTKKYFDDAEVLGWFLTRPGLSMEVNERITKIHLNNFAGLNKVLLLYDSVEREEAFYLFNKQVLAKQEGYYIYYEKNDAMQSYMIDHKDKKSIEADYIDKTSMEIRQVLERKRLEKEKKRNVTTVAYAATTVVAVVALVATATVISSLDNNGSQNVLHGEQVAVSTNNGVTSSQKPDDTTVSVSQGGIKINEGTNQGDKTETDKEQIENNQDDNKSTPRPEDIQKEEDPKETKKPSETKKPVIEVEDTDPIDSEDNKPNSEETSADTTKKYVIKKGDTLNAISMELYGNKKNVKVIMQLNNLEDDKIFAGQMIIVPTK